MCEGERDKILVGMKGASLIKISGQLLYILIPDHLFVHCT